MRKIVAAIEILSGIVVILSFVFILGVLFGQYKSLPFSIGLILTTCIATIFGLVNFFAGISLWHGSRAGYLISILLQLIQLVQIQTPNFHYLFYSLIDVIVSFSQAGVVLSYGAGASYLISLTPQPVTTSLIGINLFALALLLILLVCYARRRRV